MVVSEIMTPEQVARYLQISLATVYRYIRQGRLVAFRIGPRYRISREHLDLFLVARSTAQPGLREYSPEDVERFIQEDHIDPATREIGQYLVRALLPAK